MTVLLTTHDLDEAARLADTVGIVDEGRLVVVGSPDELIAEMGDDSMHVQGEAPSDAFATAAGALDFVTEVVPTDSGVQLGVDSGDRRLTEVVRLAAEVGYPIEAISVARPTLGDVFLKYTGRALRD